MPLQKIFATKQPWIFIFAAFANFSCAFGTSDAKAGPETTDTPNQSNQSEPVLPSSSTAVVYIVRHGEKPDSGPDLNEQGKLRASLLPTWFANHPEDVTHGLPVAVFAAAPASPGGSVRSIKTCAPYASQQHVPLNSSFVKDQYDAAARLILSAPSSRDKSVLVCWEHKMIPYLAHVLGATTAPDTWPDDTFDRVWMLTFHDGKFVSFQNLPQQLLPDDSTQ